MEQPQNNNKTNLILFSIIALLVGLGVGYGIGLATAPKDNQLAQTNVTTKDEDSDKKDKVEIVNEQKSQTENIKQDMVSEEDKNVLAEVKPGKTLGYRILKIDIPANENGMGGGYQLIYRNPSGKWFASAQGNGYPTCDEFTEDAKKAFFENGECVETDNRVAEPDILK